MKWYRRLLKNPRVSLSSLAVLCVCFYAYTIVTAPPRIEATNLRPTNPAVAIEAFPFEGTVSPNSELLINGISVPVQTNGRFSYELPLSEGDNTVTMTVKKNGKSISRTFSLHRFTKSQTATKQQTDTSTTIPTNTLGAAQPEAELNEESATRPTPQGSFTDGTFTIGRDIVAGTYSSTNPGSCRYESASKSGSISSSIASILNGKKEITVTISPDDISFTSTGCGTWTRVE